jgi:hypothetical protein
MLTDAPASRGSWADNKPGRFRVADGSKSPSDALDHLLSTPRLKLEEKLALADAIRAGFRK